MRPSNPLVAALVGFALLLQMPAVFAAPGAATVEVVQAPAWRERDGVTLPLAAGMALQSGDVLRTGEGARAYLMLAEGSRVKLGEAARFTFHSRSLNPAGAFRGALDVLAGAFRFTTGQLSRAHSGDLAIRVGTATIGIRGTDLWGRTSGAGDVVALLEGRIEITRGGETTELTQPLSFFDAPSGRAAEVRMLDAEDFGKLARQTEILPGDGAAGVKGKWRVLAATAASEEAALNLYDRIRNAGFAARIRPLRAAAGGWRYELFLGGFASAAEAAATAARLKTAATGVDPRVLR